MLTVFVLYVKSIYFRAMYVCPSLEAHKLALHIINCKKKLFLMKTSYCLWLTSCPII